MECELPIVLILGSGPSVVDCRNWPRGPFTRIVAINNAWRVRPDWDFLIHPDDFPPGNRPPRVGRRQRVVTSADYVPRQNGFGGFVYAGGTMAFTAGYWALSALRPRVMAFLGCDMVYAATGRTHFYGRGAPDPLRADISLRSLEAKSARLMLIAAELGCACVNLSPGESRLVFPRARRDELTCIAPHRVDPAHLAPPRRMERRLGYMVPSGRYWAEEARFDPAKVDRLDAMWQTALDAAMPELS